MADLKTKGFPGFGSYPIHSQLLLAQLDQCVQLHPPLLDQGNFVNTYMTKLRPSDDVVWGEDQEQHVAYLDRLWVRIASVLVLGVTAALAVPISEQMSRSWLFWTNSLTDREIDPILPSLGVRVGFMALALVMSFAVLALMPKQRTWFTSLGAYTLYVYLGHSVVIVLLQASPWYSLMSGATEMVVTVLLGVALTLLLCTPWVRAGLRWAVEPQLTWFLRQDSALRAPSGAGGTDADGNTGSGGNGDGGREKEKAGV